MPLEEEMTDTDAKTGYSLPSKNVLDPLNPVLPEDLRLSEGTDNERPLQQAGS